MFKISTILASTGQETIHPEAKAIPLTDSDTNPPRWQVALVFAVGFAGMWLLHLRLLQLPYFWDEAGYYIPAARDLLLSGSPIPHSTPSNAHPPLVMAYLALMWKLAGFSPLVTRSAMLLVSAFALAGLFRLARRVAPLEVAAGTTLCTALYPVFFAQSSMAHVDLAAAGFTFWALGDMVQRRPARAAAWFALAALAKETAIIAPLALLGLAAVCHWRRNWCERLAVRRMRAREAAWLLVPLALLAAWYLFHYFRTGYVFGNPEFFRYNVQSTLNPARMLLALGLRVWQSFGYMHLGLLTLAMLLAMRLPARRAGDGERPRIATGVQAMLLCVVAAYVAAMAAIGGAVLARYMLPASPLVILLGISTLWRRLRHWPAAIALIGAAFILGWVTNPPYGFSPEDNLAYSDYIALHQDAARYIAARYPHATVMTAWPASDELSRPYLGYVENPVRVFRVEDFTAEQVMSAAEMRSRFDVALVFSTKYEPRRHLVDRWARWQSWKRRFFGYHRDLPPQAAAQVLGGDIVFSEQRDGQWVAVIQMEREYEASRKQGQFRVSSSGFEFRSTASLGREFPAPLLCPHC